MICRLKNVVLKTTGLGHSRFPDSVAQRRVVKKMRALVVCRISGIEWTDDPTRSPHGPAFPPIRAAAQGRDGHIVARCGGNQPSSCITYMHGGMVCEIACNGVETGWGDGWSGSSGRGLCASVKGEIVQAGSVPQDRLVVCRAGTDAASATICLPGSDRRGGGGAETAAGPYGCVALSQGTRTCWTGTSRWCCLHVHLGPGCVLITVPSSP